MRGGVSNLRLPAPSSCSTERTTPKAQPQRMAKVYIDGDWDDEDRIKRKSADFLTRARQGAVAAATDAVSGKATVEWKPRTGKHRSSAIASKAVIFDIASSASAGTGSSANAAPLDWLGWRARVTGSKAEKKAARRLVHKKRRSQNPICSSRKACITSCRRGGTLPNRFAASVARIGWRTCLRQYKFCNRHNFRAG